MKIICLVIGKKHDADLTDAIEKYEKRIRPYADFRFDYLPASNKVDESNAILKYIKPGDFVVLLDESGEMVTTKQLTESIHERQLRGAKRLVLVIGGAYGVDESVFERSDKVLSFSKFTFAHQLMRLLVVEQLYRSLNLLAGGKYHHD